MPEDRKTPPFNPDKLKSAPLLPEQTEALKALLQGLPKLPQIQEIQKHLGLNLRPENLPPEIQKRLGLNFSPEIQEQLGLNLPPNVPIHVLLQALGTANVRRERSRGKTTAGDVERVREFLDQRDWPQQKLAEKADLPVESIGRLLAGRRMDKKTWDKVWAAISRAGTGRKHGSGDGAPADLPRAMSAASEKPNS